MKNLFLTFLFGISCNMLFAQNDTNVDDIKIRITNTEVVADCGFSIDIYIWKNTANIIYANYDSIRHEAVKKDPQFQDINKRLYMYKSDDPKGKLAWDTVGKIFDRHRNYTYDSTKINLKKDTAYKNLIAQILKASKDELSPDINANAKTTGMYIITTDGGSFNINIVTPTGKRSISSRLPEPVSQPLLFNFLKSTLGKKPNSVVLRSILKNYPAYK